MKQEPFDIYNENKQKTGKIKIRNKDILEDGEYVLLSHAIIINSERKMLISKRSKHKENNPSLWEINGGVCISGENSLQCIVREIKEELGLDLSMFKGILLKECKIGKRFDDVYLFKVDVNISDLIINEECDCAQWVTVEEYIKLLENKEIANTELFGEEDYKKCINMLFRI